jgi:hypothetical protein
MGDSPSESFDYSQEPKNVFDILLFAPFPEDDDGKDESILENHPRYYIQ